MARPHKNPGDRKSVDLRIPVTIDQKEIVMRAAQIVGTDMATFIRPIIIKQSQEIIQANEAVAVASTTKKRPAKRD